MSSALNVTDSSVTVTSPPGVTGTSSGQNPSASATTSRRHSRRTASMLAS